MSGVGFEPTKHMHAILSRTPLTRLGYPCLQSIVYNDEILFLTELLAVINRLPLLGSNQRPIG